MSQTASNYSRPTVFETPALPRLGRYIQDDDCIPFYNDPANDVVFQPGEPILVQWGGAQEVFLNGPDAIWPGQMATLHRYFQVDLPADISANTVLGTELYWDVSNSRVSLEADVTNGFSIGEITKALPSKPVELSDPDLSSGRIICADTNSVQVRVISKPGKSCTTKGTVTTY